MFNVLHAEGIPRYMSGKGRRVGVRNKEGSMGSGKKTRKGVRNRGGTGFMTREWVRVKKKISRGQKYVKGSR